MTFSIVMNLTLTMLVAAMFLALYRLVRGPSLPDRVVALDLIGILAVGIISAYGIVANNAVFFDVAIVLGLIAFLGTVAFARYVERRSDQ